MPALKLVTSSLLDSKGIQLSQFQFVFDFETGVKTLIIKRLF